MAFEELDARVIGSTISIRLDGPSPGVSPRTPAAPTPPRPAAAPVQPVQPKAAAPDVARAPGAVSPRPAPEAVVRSAPSSPEPAVVPKGKGRALFVMKPLNAERMRTAWAVVAVVFVVMVGGDIWLHGGAKFIEGFLPTVHVPLKSSPNAVATTAPAQSTAPAVETTAPQKAGSSAVAATPVAQASGPATPEQPQPKAQPVVASAHVVQPATVTSVAVQSEPVKTVTVNPVPATVMASVTPVLPIPPAAPLPVHRRAHPVSEAPRHVEREASQQPSQQNSPILVGGQYSNKATDSKGSDTE